MLGLVQAFGELRLALVRRGDELHEHGGALDEVGAGLAEAGEELLVPRLHLQAYRRSSQADGTTIRGAPQRKVPAPFHL